MNYQKGAAKAFDDAQVQLNVAVSNAVSMQKEINELKANESKLQIDCQARISAAERKSNFTAKELTEVRVKLEKALSDHDRKDAEYAQLRRELNRAQSDLMNVREDLREAQEKAANDLALVDRFWEMQMEITNCESYRLGWQERDKPEADRVDPDEADRARGITPGVYTLKELVNGVIRDVVDDDHVPAEPSSTIVQQELPLVEPLPVNRSVETGGDLIRGERWSLMLRLLRSIDLLPPLMRVTRQMPQLLRSFLLSFLLLTLMPPALM